MIDADNKPRVARESLIRPATRELVHAFHAAGMIAISVEGTHPKEVLEQHASIIIAAITPACLDLHLRRARSSGAQNSQPA